MSYFLIILGCAVGFAVMGLLTRGLAHHDHGHSHASSGPHDETETCGGCSLNCETTEVRDV